MLVNKAGRWPFALAIFILASSALIWLWWRPWLPDPAGPAFKIGYQDSRPAIYREDGQPKGLLVKIMEEACRRRDIPFEWVYCPQGPDEALRSGTADLWPQVGDLPERRRYLYISEPWDASTIWIVVNRSGGQSPASYARAGSIAVQAVPINTRLAAKHFPAARTVLRKSPAEVLVAVCRGEADAGLISSGRVVVQSLNSVEVCHDVLDFVPLPVERMTWGIGATFVRPDAYKAADAIRAEISVMALDNTLSSISFREMRDPLNEIGLITELDQASRRFWWMVAGITVLSALLIFIAWQSRSLRRARREAESSNSAKGQFLANMSHEIRTPLNGILGSAELLRETQLAPDQLDLVGTMQRSAEALLSIIEDILDFSKIASGRFTIVPQPCDVAALFTDIHALLRPLAEAKGLTLVCDSTTLRQPFLVLDGGRLRQVILNLAYNAVKFTAKGTVTAHITSFEVGPGLAELHCTVRDTGCGIPQNKLPLLFRDFTQLNPSAGGTGLGLAISRHLIEMMSGQISVKSTEGQGSEFWFHVAAPVAPSLTSEVTSPEPTSCPSLRILVAEDNAVNQAIIRRMLEKRGMSVTLVADGAQAVARATSDHFHLVLMDHHMPVLDGIAATQAIRAAGIQIPIVAFTASAMDWEVHRCCEAGMNDVLTKPVQAGALDVILQRFAPVQAGS